LSLHRRGIVEGSDDIPAATKPEKIEAALGCLVEDLIEGVAAGSRPKAKPRRRGRGYHS
jgi:hypothetical protein